MPNGDGHVPCPSLVELAEYATQEITRLREERGELKDRVQKLEGERGSLLQTIRLLKGES